MTRQVERRRLSFSATATNNPVTNNNNNSQQIGESTGLIKNQPLQLGNERTPLLNSIGAAAESLVNNSVVGASMQQGVTWRMAAFLLVNTALGAGMLNYPYAYNQIGGLGTAALMQVVLLVFISSTMFILVYCADFNRDDTYHDVLLSMCGRRAQHISALSILLTCYGINVTFLVIIGDQYDRIFNSLLEPGQLEQMWYLDRKFTIFVTSVLFIWPMCYAQRLDFLRYASVLGMFAMLYVAFLTVYEHFVLDEATIAAVVASHATATGPGGGGGSGLSSASANQTQTAAPSLAQETASAPNSFKWWFEPMAVVPVLCFAYQTHEVIVPVYACMRERFIASFMKATLFGLFILFLLYNLVGAFGYLTFGDQVGADIMSLYDAQDPIVLVGIVALVIKFITTYPPLMFCGRSALDGLYAEWRQLSSSEFKQNEPARRAVISTLWFLSTVALAVFAPDISVTLQLLGSMASINVFVFPGMCLVSLTRRLRRARHALLMGELPPDCQQPASATSGAPCQRAKDYHMISGSFFGAAMKRRQQQHQLLHQQLGNSSGGGSHLLHSNSLRNQLIGSGSFTGASQQHLAAAAPYGCHSNSNGQGDIATATTTTNGNGKHFAATFASLLEFENNLVKSTRSNEDLDGEHGSLLLLNGMGASSGLANIATGTLASAPMAASSSSSSGLQLSGSSHQHWATAAGATLQNGHSSNHQMQHWQQLARARARQEHFERIIANGSGIYEDKSIGDNDNLHELNSATHARLSFTAQQSTTTSLLDKFGSSIAPSTVAQIGISRCAAMGLYMFAGLLIAFGTFIFILELVNISGLAG